jgi:DNA (cytosine-5)-methyltransferase 1
LDRVHEAGRSGVTAYYNEIEPFCCQWLRNLIKMRLIAKGDVDERSIVDVRADDLKQYDQCHFFAGIGLWSHALRLAGWPDNRPVWTGSCPCQPFSVAGQGANYKDIRHLWPEWFRLISECRPSVLFGEQVDAAIKHGWLDLVQDDLEGEDYAVGSAVLPAAGVTAYHLRHRLYFLAYRGEKDWMGNADCQRMETELHVGVPEPGGRETEGEVISQSIRFDPWKHPEWIWCIDGKARPVEPGVCPMVNGHPHNMEILRALGNAIVPQVAAEFIKAFMECKP